MDLSTDITHIHQNKQTQKEAHYVEIYQLLMAIIKFLQKETLSFLKKMAEADTSELQEEVSFLSECGLLAL